MGRDGRRCERGTARSVPSGPVGGLERVMWADGEELVGSTGRRLLVLFCFYVTGAWSHFNDNGLFIGLHPKTNEQASKHAN